MRSVKSVAVVVLLSATALGAQPPQAPAPEPRNPPMNPERSTSTAPRAQSPLMRRFNLTPEQFAEWGPATLWSAPVVIVTFLVIALQLAPARPMDALRVRFERLHPVALGASMAAVILLVAATVSSQGVPPFIYFSF